MFPFLEACDPSDDEIDALVGALKSRVGGQNHRVPGGYTYLGQFVDHDITFDPLSKLQRDNDPHAVVNFRTPRFDLDSLYGSGPVDQPFLYDWTCRPHPGVKLLVGHNPEHRELAAIDLPRNEQGRALLGDARNDENLVIAQLHLLFIRFHNKVVDRVRTSDRQGVMTADEVFAQAQRIVRWHYQWIVVHDYLPRIVGGVAGRVLRPGAGGGAPTVERRFYTWDGDPAIPVEFSGAAYRFGHSMVRDGYRMRAGVLAATFVRDAKDERHLGGFRRLPAELEIDWDLFFFKQQTPPPGANKSMRIDASLAAPLFFIPPNHQELARLNLQRGRALGLPSGPDVARAMSIEPLTHEEFDAHVEGEQITASKVAALRAALHRLPLWAYILLEAEIRSQAGLQLGPVGGRIVAEVLVGLLEADESSYLRQWPTWTPELPRSGKDADPDDFTMIDLVAFTNDGA